MTSGLPQPAPGPSACSAIRWHDAPMSENPTDNDRATEEYDPKQDPDSDPAMLQSQHPDHREQNERDPAEGPDDESATEN